MQLPPDAYDRICELVKNPPEPSERLRAAFRRAETERRFRAALERIRSSSAMRALLVELAKR